MTAERVLIIISLLGATVAAGTAVWAFARIAAAADSLRELSDDARARLVPLLEKADVTVDAANAELWRIDAAITRFEDASVRVSSATGTLTEIVQTPAGVVTEVAQRVRRAWRQRRDVPVTDETDASEVVTSEAATEQAPQSDPEDPWHKTESL